MTTVACIIARTNSTRLPKKVLIKIKGKTVIEYIIDKVKQVKNIDNIYICTSTHPDDKVLLDIAKRNGINGFAGSEDSPIDRILEVIGRENPDRIIRITGDNIFTDEIYLEKMIEEQIRNPVIEYSRTECLPIGVTAEVIRADTLKRCYKFLDPKKSEYMMFYLFDPDTYCCQVIIPESKHRAEYCSLTVDTIHDLERTRIVIEKKYSNGRVYLDDILSLNNQEGIPFFHVNKDMLLKLPEGNITFSEYREMMMDRTNKSMKLYLMEGYYESKKYN